MLNKNKKIKIRIKSTQRIKSLIKKPKIKYHLKINLPLEKLIKNALNEEKRKRYFELEDKS